MPADDQYGDFKALAPLLATLERIQVSIYREDDLVWVLPTDVLSGVTSAYGIPVWRAAVPEPLLAHHRCAEADEGDDA